MYCSVAFLFAVCVNCRTTKCAGSKPNGMQFSPSWASCRASCKRNERNWPGKRCLLIILNGFFDGRPRPADSCGPGGLRLLTQQFSGVKIFLFLFNFAASLAMRSDSSCDMAKLTKRDIVVAISNQTGMVQHEVFDVVQRTLDKITDSLANNVAVELRNFGVFQPRLTKPRVGRNPNQPGSSFVIPPRATVKFKAGKIMRQRVEKLSRELKETCERTERQKNTAPQD